MEQSIAMRISVRGRVQGVGFRFATVRTAQRLGLAGWVRNLPEGCVEIVAQGPKTAVDEMIDFAATGPSHARVSSVETATLTLDPDLVTFDVRH